MYREGTGEIIDKMSVNTLKILTLIYSNPSEEIAEKLAKTYVRRNELEEELKKRLGKSNCGSFLELFFKLHSANK